MVCESQFEGGKKFFRNALFIVITLLMGACASTEKSVVQGENAVVAEKSKVDPYEDFNRSMFSFNSHLDHYVAKPISDAYLWITPHFFETAVSNFFSNLKDISVVLNDNMQGKFGQGAEDAGRLLTNSTLGLLGLVDVASELGLKKHQEDFGQTLAVWGVPQGPYLVLPMLGPTTARGFPAGFVDIAANPTSYIGMPVQLISMLNTRATNEGAIKFIDEAAIDPYVFTREAYLQNLQHLISDGKDKTNIDILPMEDELDEVAEIKDKQVLTEADKSLDRTIVALDKASASFEESSEKLDKLKKKRFKRH